MKTRRIILALLAAAVALLIGFPHSTRIARGLTVTFEGEAASAIWFPYVINDGNFNTGITVQGNATVLPENVNPEIWIYYYSPDGTCQTEYKPTGLTKATNTQWSAPVSAIYPTQGYGSLLVLTNIPDARAQGFVFDVTGTHTLANVPVITSYTISGVDENGVMVRREGFEPPDGWDTLEPGQTEIDPSLHHSTLIFPYVIKKYGYDTGFCISNSYNASGIGDRAAALYLYNSNGVLSRKIVVDMDSTNKAVSPMFVGLLSDLGYTEIATLAQRPGIDACEEYAPFVGEGWILAVTNIPCASGCSFTDYSYIHSMTGFAAQIDNNIYGVDDSGESPTFQPLRLETPPVQHTSMFVPLVLTNFGYQTTINLTTAVNPGDTFTADCYLYNTDGSLRTGMRPDETPFDGHFQITMQSIYDMPEMPLIIINSQYISVLSIEGVEDVCVNPGEFQGWMLIVVNQPGAYATVVAATSATNQFAGYYGISDPDVIGVDMEAGYEGNILRENPLPIDENSTGQWRLPFFSTAGGWDTAVGTIITRNRAEWPGGNLTSSYVGYAQNGESAMVYEPTPAAPPAAPGVLPASGPILLGALDEELGFNDQTGALYVTDSVPHPVGYAVYMVNEGDCEINIPEVCTGQITTPVNLVGTTQWNSIILYANSSVNIPGAHYRWEIVTDNTHVDRGNLRQDGDPQDNLIESEASWVEFTAETLSTALDDVKVKVTYLSPAGYPLWADCVTFTTADIRYLAYCPDAANPANGLQIQSLLTINESAISTSRPDLQEDIFFRLVVGLSNSIATTLNTSGARVCLRLAGIDEDGNHLDTEIIFNETANMETVHDGCPGYQPLSNVTYYTTINQVGAVGTLYYSMDELPPAMLSTAPPPTPYSPRSYVVCYVGGTLRPFLVIQQP